MADKNQAAGPFAPANKHDRGDEESAGALTKEQKRKRNMKRLTYFAIFVVFQIIVITIFSLTVMKVKRPKFRVGSSTIVETLEVGNATSPWLNMRLNAQFRVKNTNFGQYKFDNTTVSFYYRGIPVGEVLIVKSKAKFLSTKKITAPVVVELASNDLSSATEWGSDISNGILPLSSLSTLNGKVHLMLIMKKKKSTQMNCTMEVVIATKAIQNLRCK